MGEYSVVIVSKAEKEFLKLPSRVRASLTKKILSLEDNPRPLGAKKLKETDYYRIRAGDFRVIYSVHDTNRTVKILSIGHRREVYR
jgi:mRNA interferase RelE/StbE